MFVGVLTDCRLRVFEDGLRRQSGFGSLACALPEELSRVGGFHFAAAIGRGVGDERAQTLAPVDDAVALELLVSALHGDDADEQVPGELPEGRQRRPTSRRPSLISRLRLSTICRYSGPPAAAESGAIRSRETFRVGVTGCTVYIEHIQYVKWSISG